MRRTMKSNSFSHSWWGDEDVWHALGFPVDFEDPSFVPGTYFNATVSAALR